MQNHSPRHLPEPHYVFLSHARPEAWAPTPTPPCILPHSGDFAHPMQRAASKIKLIELLAQLEARWPRRPYSPAPQTHPRPQLVLVDHRHAPLPFRPSAVITGHALAAQSSCHKICYTPSLFPCHICFKIAMLHSTPPNFHHGIHTALSRRHLLWRCIFDARLFDRQPWLALCRLRSRSARHLPPAAFDPRTSFSPLLPWRRLPCAGRPLACRPWLRQIFMSGYRADRRRARHALPMG